MKNRFLLCMLGMVSGCVAEVPVDYHYPSDYRYRYHGYDGYYWLRDNREHKHFHDRDNRHFREGYRGDGHKAGRPHREGHHGYKHKNAK